MSDPVRWLAESSLFATMGAEERDSLLALLHPRRFAAGEPIFSRGDPTDSLFLLRSGLVRASLETDTGDSLELSEVRPGELFGEIGFFDGGPRIADARAVEEAEALELHRTKFLEFLHKHPHAALDLLAVMERRVRHASDILLNCASRNVNEEHDDKLSFGQFMADRVASFGGSWTFILFFSGLLFTWVGINVFLLVHRPFDPYPFILLNLVLSTLSAFQAPIIMMSQNRQSSKDRMKADLDYEVNLKAELEVAQLHRKVDRLYELLKAQSAHHEPPAVPPAHLLGEDRPDRAPAGLAPPRVTNHHRPFGAV